MTSKQSTIVRFPLPTLSILGFVLIYLKVADYVDWSWLWILSPFWLPSAVGLVILTILIFTTLVASIMSLFFGKY